jgi:hypothetical protein
VSISGGKSKSGANKATQRQQNEVYNAGKMAGDSIPQPILQSQGTFGAQQTAGQQGLDAMTGNAAAAEKFMNPYQQQVMDKMNAQFANQNQMTTQGINDQATQAGAFGGSRHGVAQGVALGENARNQGMMTANMLSQGFEGAMGRAGQVADLGFGGARAGAELGMQAGNPAVWRSTMLNRGFNPLQASQGWNASASRNR